MLCTPIRDARLHFPAAQVHFPVTGVSGIDLYAWDDATSQYRFVAPSQVRFFVTVRRIVFERDCKSLPQIPYGNPRWTALMTPGNVNVTQIGGKVGLVGA